jgi:hypothetical protein
MKLNGVVQITRARVRSYRATFAPLGVPLSSCATPSFSDEKELRTFLAGPLKIDPREIQSAFNALVRNGSYCIYEVWLSEAEIQEHGLGAVWALSCSRQQLCYPVECLA